MPTVTPFPSIKTLTTQLNLSRAQAIALRQAMSAEVTHWTVGESVLEQADAMLNGFGVEGFVLPEGSTRPDKEVEYVNMGDGYTATLLKVNGRYKVGAWADIVEAY